jgi:hypothetical protein
VPGQNETSKLERLRSAILAAARSADFEAMHDAIVAYHQLLGIEEGEPDPRQALVSNERATHTVGRLRSCRLHHRRVNQGAMTERRGSRAPASRGEAAANGTGAALKCFSAAKRSGRSI